MELPATPAGHQRVGWGGFTLALPENWNLSLLSPAAKMDREGLLVFSDLRGPALEVRWKTPRVLKLLPAAPSKSVAELSKQLARKHPVEVMDGVHLLRSQGVALVAGERRAFELHCPRAPEKIESIARDFQMTARIMAHGPWLWAVYGMSAWLPKEARLRAAALRAGDCRLEFTIPAVGKVGARRVTLAVFSLAHQQLRNRPLKIWAAQELSHVREHPDGTWEEGENCATWRVQYRKLGRLWSCQTAIQHDPGANRIRWTHEERQSKKG